VAKSGPIQRRYPRRLEIVNMLTDGVDASVDDLITQTRSSVVATFTAVTKMDET
jgi:hypothetical protein